MANTSVQHSKILVWEYWQKLHLSPKTITNINEQYLAPEILWQGPQPFNEITGQNNLFEQVWQPIFKAFPDLQRRTYLFLGGEVGNDVKDIAETEVWVAGMGDYIGTFANDWLGIPATGQTIHFRFGEFSRVVDNKIVEIYTLFDIISLMRQAGFAVLPPSKGHDIWVPGPINGGGVLLEPQDAKESEKSFELLNRMLFEGMQYKQGQKAKKPGMEGYWTEDMVWYGPDGIGSVYGLKEFYRNAQGPIVAGHPDRIGGFHKARFGEGHCAAMGGLKALQGTHTGKFLGIEPSGNKVAWRIMDFYTRKGDLLFEDWVLVDLIDACKQCGLDIFARLKAMKKAC